MSTSDSKLLVLLLIISLPLFFCWEPISSTFFALGTGAIISTFFSKYDYPTLFGEQCNENWLKFDDVAFESDLKIRLFGQHLVNSIVPKCIKVHTSKKNPKKALVMAFHGWTGSGKNHVAKMVIQSLYKAGAKSSFVHWYISTHDFPHESEIEKYRARLRKEIPEYTKKCGQSLFIFDEVDKMMPGVIDVLAPFLDFYDEVDGIDYRKNIFIFLSNAGGNEITRVALRFWMEGKDREDISLKEIEPLINIGAFNEKGGLQGSKIIKKNLIDVYVPFLPLEKTHVRECIVQELNERGYSGEIDIFKVANELIYYPPDLDIFSISGCKKISHKVDLHT